MSQTNFTQSVTDVKEVALKVDFGVIISDNFCMGFACYVIDLEYIYYSDFHIFYVT